MGARRRANRDGLATCHPSLAECRSCSAGKYANGQQQGQDQAKYHHVLYVAITRGELQVVKRNDPARFL